MNRPPRNNSHYDGKIAGLYDLGDTLGRGHFAVVKLAKHVFTGEQVAVKVIDKTKLDEVSRAHLFQEVRCMKLVQHPNVVRLYEVIDTQTKLYLILELGDGGDMYDYIMKHEHGVEEQVAKKYFRQIVHAISYCHRLHVVHRDLKPENVVFFEKLGMVKLTDFGFSNKFCPGQKLETSCGSLAYSAPEILLGDSYDAPKVDVWSLGVILYMMVCGHAPFQEANDSETLTMIMDCKYTIPPYVSEECHRLISRMLIRDPEKRATLEEIANDPWLISGDALQPADYLPLVSREHLSEEDHSIIIQKMVNGSIATKEEIVEALDRNDYNHITATYYLLAERKLRAQRQEKAQMLNRTSRADLSPIAVTPGVSSASPSPAQEKPLATMEGLVSPCVPNISLDMSHFTAGLSSCLASLTQSLPDPSPSSSLLVPGSRSNLPLARKCSIVREEDDLSGLIQGHSPSKSPVCEEVPIEDMEVEVAPLSITVPVELKRSPLLIRPIMSLPVPSQSVESTPRQAPLPSARLKSVPGRRLHAVRSSPQLLGGLSECRESSAESVIRKPLYTGKMRSRVGRNRTTSCSSSDASDDDAEKRRPGPYHPSRRDRDGDGSGLGSNGSGGTLGPGDGGGGGGGGGGASSSGGAGGTGSPSSAGHSSGGGTPSHCSGQNGQGCHDEAQNGFPVDSTDSLDILSEPPPRLVNSVSCGDLTMESFSSRVLDSKQECSDKLNFTDIAAVVNKEEQVEIIEAPVAQSPNSKISTSFSLVAGLSCLSGTSPNKNKEEKSKLGNSLVKLMPNGTKSTLKSQLDINQNGWRGKNSKSKSQHSVVDVKMASKCCTLC